MMTVSVSLSDIALEDRRMITLIVSLLIPCIDRSHKEIMQSVISKAKMHKHARQEEKRVCVHMAIG